MPDYFDRLNYNYWTFMSRLGCSGKIKNCFSNATGPEADIFWSNFDRTDSGACVALQWTPLNRNTSANYAVLTPVFSSCSNLNFLACEGEGSRSKYVEEREISVNRTSLLIEEGQSRSPMLNV